MTCKDIEMLMADALGGELTSQDQAKFAEHVAHCAACRVQYEAGRLTIERMRSLPAAPEAEARPLMKTRAAVSQGRQSRWILTPALLRYAAVILLGFTAGYVSKAKYGEHQSTPRVAVVPDHQADPGRATPTVQAGGSFESALTNAYRRRPAGSDLAKAMSVLFRSG